MKCRCCLNYTFGRAVLLHSTGMVGSWKMRDIKLCKKLLCGFLFSCVKRLPWGMTRGRKNFPKPWLKKLSFLQQRVTTQHQEALFSVVSLLLNSSKCRKNWIAACNLYHCTPPLFSCPPSSDTLYSHFVPSMENSTLIPNPNLFSLSAPHAQNLSSFSLFIQLLLWFLWPSSLVS